MSTSEFEWFVQCELYVRISTTVQPSNFFQSQPTGSFQNQPTNPPLHSVIKTVEFKCGHRVWSDCRTVIYNVKKFFDERSRRLEPIKVGDVVQITAEATGLSKKSTVKWICSEGAITGGNFGSPVVRAERRLLQMTLTALPLGEQYTSSIHVRSTQQSKCCCRLFTRKESFKEKRQVWSIF